MKENPKNRGSLGGKMRMLVKEHCRDKGNHTKNRLWKLILKMVTVYRSQDDGLVIHLYPNLPQ